jgi:putative transport protein
LRHVSNRHLDDRETPVPGAPGILLGVAGAGMPTPALAAIQEVAKSAMPTLGSGVSYTVGNVFLALSATAIVLLVN